MLNSGQLHYITFTEHIEVDSFHNVWQLSVASSKTKLCDSVVCIIEQAPSNHHRGSFVQKCPDKEILIVMFLKKTTDDCQNGEGKT